MRYYAKTTTDRGENGKGGDEEIHVEINAGHKSRKRIAKVSVIHKRGQKHHLRADIDGEIIEKDITSE